MRSSGGAKGGIETGARGCGQEALNPEPQQGQPFWDRVLDFQGLGVEGLEMFNVV